MSRVRVKIAPESPSALTSSPEEDGFVSPGTEPFPVAASEQIRPATKRAANGSRMISARPMRTTGDLWLKTAVDVTTVNGSSPPRNSLASSPRAKARATASLGTVATSLSTSIFA